MVWGPVSASSEIDEVPLVAGRVDDRTLGVPERSRGATLGGLCCRLGPSRLGDAPLGVDELGPGVLDRVLQIRDPPGRGLELLLRVVDGFGRVAGFGSGGLGADPRLLECLLGTSDREVVTRRLRRATRRRPCRCCRRRRRVPELEPGRRGQFLGEPSGEQDRLQLGFDRRPVERRFDGSPLPGWIVGQPGGGFRQFFEQRAALTTGGAQIGVHAVGGLELGVLDRVARGDQLGDAIPERPGDLVDAPGDDGRPAQCVDLAGKVLPAGGPEFAGQGFARGDELARGQCEQVVDADLPRSVPLLGHREPSGVGPGAVHPLLPLVQVGIEVVALAPEFVAQLVGGEHEELTAFDRVDDALSHRVGFHHR